MMTEKQSTVLKWWVAFEAKSRVPPTYAEAAAALGYENPGAVTAHAAGLIRKGYLEWNPALPPKSSRGVRATEKGQQWAAEQAAA